MFTLILGAVGHGKVNYALNQAIEKSDGKKVLIISNELRPDKIIGRISKILDYKKEISPSEIRVVTDFGLSSLSMGKDYDVVTFLGYVPPYSEKYSNKTAMDSLVLLLNGLNEANPSKEIMATIQLARPSADITFNKVKDLFLQTDVETSDIYDHVLVYRDPESEKFKIVSLHNKTTDTIDKREFFCEG